MGKSHLITNVITIAERLKEAREKAGLSQEQLAKRASVSQGTIANIENGIRKQPRQLLSIARALGVTPDWLDSGKVQTSTASHHVAEEPSRPWAVQTSKIHQALSVLEKSLADLDLQGRERVAPLFESFARSPGPIIKDDIVILLANKSETLEETGNKKTG